MEEVFGVDRVMVPAVDEATQNFAFFAKCTDGEVRSFVFSFSKN